jgi:hypothetical protein
VGDPQGQALRAALREVIRAVVTRQMRRGSLPPRAMIVNWRRVVDRCYAGDSLDRVRPLIARIDEAVPLVSQADTRGYFHAMAPARTPPSPHPCRDAAPSPPTARARIVAAAGHYPSERLGTSPREPRPHRVHSGHGGRHRRDAGSAALPGSRAGRASPTRRGFRRPNRPGHGRSFSVNPSATPSPLNPVDS